jgi:hypothetical protein
VFPRPRATTTLVVDLGSTEAALGAMAQLGRGPLDLDALDLEPPARLLVRLGGDPDALPARAARLADAVPAAARELGAEDDAALWRDAAELAWVPSTSRVVRVALTARSVPALEAVLATAGARARYSLGANVAWIAWPEERPLAALDAALGELGLAGVVLTGDPDGPLLGRPQGGAFARRVRAALDPHARFLET